MRNLHLTFAGTTWDKSKVEISQKIVAFSEYMDFTENCNEWKLNFWKSLHWLKKKSTIITLEFKLIWFQWKRFSKCSLLSVCAWNCSFKTIAQKVPTGNFCIQFKKTVCKFFACYSQLLARSAILYLKLSRVGMSSCVL